MKSAVIVVLLLATPSIAGDYTVTSTDGSLNGQTSVFRQIAFPESDFAEKMQESSASFSAANSSFGLKEMNEETRLKTENTLSELGAKREGSTIVVDLPSDILFDFDKANIRPDARPVLAQFAEVLSAMEGSKVSIIGHTDSKGSDDYNNRLSERRAISVKSWLSDNGVTSVMTTAGKGESVPVAPNATPDGADDPAGRQKNRRVQFIIGDK